MWTYFILLIPFVSKKTNKKIFAKKKTFWKSNTKLSYLFTNARIKKVNVDNEGVNSHSGGVVY